MAERTDRRQVLSIITGAIAGVGATLATLPFIRSLNPPNHIVDYSKDITFTKLLPGDMAISFFEQELIFIVRRTEAQIRDLEKLNPKLLDPASNESVQPTGARNVYRSLNPELFVAKGHCTHLGCAPVHKPESRPEAFDETWQGGFFCACHGAKYDLAGRVYKNMPAPLNLEIPNYEIIDEHTIRVHRDEAI